MGGVGMDGAGMDGAGAGMGVGRMARCWEGAREGDEDEPLRHRGKRAGTAGAR